MKTLRVLHIANRAEKHWAKRYYSFPYKMNNGLVRNGHCVYWFSDRDIAKYLAFIPSRKFGVGICNKKLLEVCKNFRPEVVVFGHAEIIKNEVFEEIKGRYGSIIVQYDIDLLHADNKKKLADGNGIVDFNFLTTGGSVLGELANKGTRYAYIPNPVDRSIDCLENHKKENLPVDVFFAGQTSHMVDASDLRTQISSLPRDLPQIRVGLYNGVWGQDYLRLLAKARTGLSISVGLKGAGEGDGSHHHHYSSDRISQYLGNGLLTFVEKRFHLSEVYGPNILVEVESYEELKSRLDFFVRHDNLRKKQAEASWCLAHEQFNERLVAQYLLETATGLSLSHHYHWPTKVWGG